jgi:hypothetical protein
MAQHSEPMPGGVTDPMERSGGTLARRPGMFTFAAVIMFLVAGFEALSAILAFAGPAGGRQPRATWCMRASFSGASST